MREADMDAIELITNDHRTVEALFDELERAGGAKARGDVFARIKKELDAHAAIEEEMLYPTVAQRDPSTRAEVERSLAEHRLVKTLLRETAAMSPQDAGFEANVTVLRRNVEEHVTEEEGPGGVLELAARVLGPEGRQELGRRMQEHRRAVTSGTARGILTAAAEVMQSVVERGQKMMDRGTNATRRAMKAGASASRSAARRTAAAARKPARGRSRSAPSRSTSGGRRSASSRRSTRSGAARPRSTRAGSSRRRSR
jgi:hypothetical protein